MFERVYIPLDLRRKNDPVRWCLLWAVKARHTLKLMLDSVERPHSKKRTFGGNFNIKHMFYREDLDIIEIVAPDFSSITQTAYAADLYAILKVIHAFFMHSDSHGNLIYPAYGEDLQGKIKDSIAAKDTFESENKRSLIYNHPALMSSSERIAVVISTLIHKGTNEAALKAAMNSSGKIYWTKDTSDPSFVEKKWLDTFNYPVRWKKGKKIGKSYIDTAFSRLDYTRCFITHGTDSSVRSTPFILH